MAGDFGTQFLPTMAVSHYDNGWTREQMVASDSLPMHPASHVLHYASTCFEGLKAFRQQDGTVAIFRMDRNIERFAQSSRLLYLPDLDRDQTARMITESVSEYQQEVPDAPASLYIRPTHIGTEPAIGKAAARSDTSTQYVLLSPVGDYFAGGEACLRLLLDDEGVRCGHDHGMVKGGGNYASALKHIEKARREFQADQVLFCPGGDVQETGAANFILVDGDQIITKALDESFLHGITRESLLTLARDKGLDVQERQLGIEELLERASAAGCEAGLAGTAAVVAAVGTLIYKGKEYTVGDGKAGPRIRQMRDELNAIQWGRSEDRHQWLTRV
ncbi:MAG: branched-chain amino acid aminotransferase [Granulosicoccus sp.]|nr:branched-chain amino acid aminotransferase [Granulosicoccus sp.]